MDLAIRGLLSNWFNSTEDKFQGIGEVHEAKMTQTKLISFELNFHEIVELLAGAQKYGSTNGSEAKYNSLRLMLKDAYTDLRPFLLAYLRLDIEDERVGIRTIGIGTDAFEATWVAPSLQSFVESDDVFFRDRVGRAYEAIRDYTEHLHCLLETRA
jgi:hypothetical protein